MITKTDYNPKKVVSSITGMSSVKRFHGRSTLQTQTIADHSCRTAQLAFFMALEYYSFDYEKANYVSTLALFHDFPESLLECDIPSPVKNIGTIGTHVKAAETFKVKELFPKNTYLQNLMLEIAQEEDFQLMKLADYLDIGFYIRQELDFGNVGFLRFIPVFKDGISKYSDSYLKLPIVNASLQIILGD